VRSRALSASGRALAVGEPVSPAAVEPPDGPRAALGDVDELERLVYYLDCGCKAGGLRDQLA
jgi:hypothetical protein